MPEWMKERIRATDIEQFVNTFEAFPDMGWEEWDALPNVEAPTLFLTGELGHMMSMQPASGVIPEHSRSRERSYLLDSCPATRRGSPGS